MFRSRCIRATLISAAVLESVASTRSAAAQRAVENTPRFFTKVWQSDSLDISFPTQSPDGRWIAFASSGFGRSNLWVIPAGGGAPISLTTGAHVDGFPAWFPSGEKIAFVSDRIDGIMVLGFDRRTGRAVGTPRRVTLDKGIRFAISSSGDRIAYLVPTTPNHFSVRMLPATGGPAVTLGEINSESVPLVPSFSADNRHVLFTVTGAEPGSLSVVSIPVSGGTPQTVAGTLRGNLWAVPLPAQQQVLQTWGGRQGAIIAFAGDTVAIFERGTASAMVPSRDGLSALATSNKIVAPVRMVPRNGDAKNLTAGTGYDWPYAWSADGRRVVYSLGAINSSNADWSFEESNIEGTSRRALRVRPTNLSIGMATRPRDIAFSPDLRHAAFKVDSSNRAIAFTFVVVDLQTGVARQITSRADRTTVITSNGNPSTTNHGEFLYTERNNGQIDVRAAKPSGETRLIRSLPTDARGISVEADDIAFARADGDSTTIFNAHGASGEARVIARLRGRVDELAWSPDGKSIAATVYGHDPAQKDAGHLAILQLNSSGQPRFIFIGEGGYEPVWTRDASAVLYLKADKGWTQMAVWRYPVRGDGSPENLTKNETNLIWTYVASPDGNSVLISPELRKGNTLWRIDLEQAVASYRSAKERAR